MDNDHTISKFDRMYAGLQGGNNLQTKATTASRKVFSRNQLDALNLTWFWTLATGESLS